MSARRTHPHEEFKDHVLDMLRDLDGLYCKAMFGGFGLYRHEVFFGIIHDSLYFKVDDNSRVDYEQAGMEPFRPNARQTIRSYYEVPADVLEDRHTLLTWARRAIDAQLHTDT